MPFPVPGEEPVITTSYVTAGREPILLVFHDRDEDSATGGAWQFHCGNGDFSSDRLQLVALKTLIGIDPSLESVSDLPVGWSAARTTPAGPWAYTQED